MIRDATAEDLTWLVGLEHACFGTGAWGAPTLQAAIDDPAQDVLVAHTADAYAVVRTVVDVADLDRIAVLPQVRRRGVGRGMLAEAITRAEGRDAERMLLEVAADNTAAIALYVAAGFDEISRRPRYYAGGVDALVMERRLRP